MNMASSEILMETLINWIDDQEIALPDLIVEEDEFSINLESIEDFINTSEVCVKTLERDKETSGILTNYNEQISAETETGETAEGVEEYLTVWKDFSSTVNGDPLVHSGSSQ